MPGDDTLVGCRLYSFGRSGGSTGNSDSFGRSGKLAGCGKAGYTLCGKCWTEKLYFTPLEGVRKMQESPTPSEGVFVVGYANTEPAAVRNFLPPVLFSGPIMACTVCTVCTAFPGLSPSLA